ncbi:MAG: 30S ribosomal protein S11 [Candidatus Harrisonbacteria bacterium CG10_big_fil_rev_8_21_14_0_10_45_28]|uniref:Small ribosomal subunit protein uS11 n=1 Tax=Candidatus Harrisonbacteria bacterium CG10_big_fil_rev_8_21_14_0_10_45_28 TaxID=1974586 RepID=A0A2H0UN05_9BACT|nr:MAG: 30S ribosomal protein S11 [Candidatus Harrisonbacteria bacterium CG10_big_fil_rev_8_21_14_0_10_45_28]
MGKKKVTKQDDQILLKETADMESAVSQSASKKAKKKFIDGCIYVKASYNNTVVTVTDLKGNVVAWSTAGALGFKGPKKATPFAASKVVDALAEKLKKAGLENITIYLNGIGGGRDSTVRSFVNQGFNLLGIHDITPIPHNGPKPKKVRRV